MIKQFSGGECATNTYIIIDQNKCVVVDPGFMCQELVDYIKENNLHVEHILLIHAHIDHYLASGELRKTFKTKVLCHESDKAMFKSSLKYGRKNFDIPASIFNTADEFFTEYKFKLNNLEIYSIHTPGHTPGSVCFVVPQLHSILTGDTLFSDSVGNWSFRGGSFAQMCESVEKLGQWMKAQESLGQQC